MTQCFCQNNIDVRQRSSESHYLPELKNPLQLLLQQLNFQKQRRNGTWKLTYHSLILIHAKKNGSNRPRSRTISISKMCKIVGNFLHSKSKRKRKRKQKTQMLQKMDISMDTVMDILISTFQVFECNCLFLLLFC